MYDYGTDIISETLGDMWDGRLPDDLALIATSMNTLQPYLPPTSVEALKGDVELPDTLVINGVKYRKVEEE